MPIDQPPNPPSLVWVTPENSPTLNLGLHGTMVTISPDGTEVRIDWKVVEAYADDPKTDQKVRAWAAALLAVRDNTWKPISNPAERSKPHD